MTAYGTNVPFRNVHCTAASGDNPDIEVTSPDDRVWPMHPTRTSAHRCPGIFADWSLPIWYPGSGPDCGGPNAIWPIKTARPPSRFCGGAP